MRSLGSVVFPPKALTLRTVVSETVVPDQGTDVRKGGGGSQLGWRQVSRDHYCLQAGHSYP